MASDPITLRQILIEGEKADTVIDFIFGGSKITADNDSSHEIKTFAPWKENCDKQICIVKAMVFLLVMYGYERWTIKKAER